MATKFYLRSVQTGPSSWAGGTPPDSGAYYDATLETSGSGTFVTNTSAGPVTPPTAGTHVTKTAGGTKVTWVSNPLAAFTCSGTITVGVRGQESSTNANVSRIWARIGKLDSANTLTWFATATTGTSELTASAANYTITTAPTNTSFADGDRLVVELYLDDSNANMAASYTATYTENAALFVQLSEDVREFYSACPRFVAAAFGQIALTNDTSFVITAPADILDGDILLITGYHDAVTDPSTAACTGFTSKFDNTASMGSFCLWKRAAGESGNYTVDFGEAMQGASADLTVWRGCVPTGDPIDVYSNTAYVTSDTIVRAAGVTTTVRDTTLVSNARVGAYALTKPNGFIDVKNDLDSVWSERVATAYRPWRLAAATGNLDWASGSANTDKNATLIALKPARFVACSRSWWGPNS